MELRGRTMKAYPTALAELREQFQGVIRTGADVISPAARRWTIGDLTDGQLLERFLTSREEAAFETLVRRHGPMVLSVCRRVLEHAQDAEDAFQATFLVLACKASSIVMRETVGNWLYGVAYRTAQKARAAAAEMAGSTGGRITGPMIAWDLVTTFLAADFSQEERHLRRLSKVAALENKTTSDMGDKAAVVPA